MSTTEYVVSAKTARADPFASTTEYVPPARTVKGVRFVYTNDIAAGVADVVPEAVTTKLNTTQNNGKFRLNFRLRTTNGL